MIQLINNIIPEAEGAYIVGGSVRDFILGRSLTDYDIAVLGDPEEFAKRIAINSAGHLVKIGKPGQMIIRVISGDNIFDISPVNGASIEEDLNKRDFTINAMAYSLSSEKIIDHMGSMQDIAEKRIRMVSDSVFRKDPVRLIRAYRMGAFLNFEIEPETISAIKDNAGLIQNSAGERIRAELFKILRTSKSHYYLSQMADTGLLLAIFPELGRLKGCFQGRHHRYDVFEHTMKAFYHLEGILNNYRQFIPKVCGQLGHYINENRAALLKCAILLHDIGKPLARTVNSKGSVHFYGHGKKGADAAKKIVARLKFSTRERCYIDSVVRNHIRPLSLFAVHQKGILTQKSLTRFFIKCGDNTPDLLLHAAADIRGKKDERDEKGEAFVEFAREMIHDFFLSFKPREKKPPLITGHDLINEFGLTPSPIFKTVLNLVEESRLSKEIESREAALALAEKILKANKDLSNCRNKIFFA